MSTAKKEEINRGRKNSSKCQEDKFEYQENKLWNSLKHLEKKRLVQRKTKK